MFRSPPAGYDNEMIVNQLVNNGKHTSISTISVVGISGLSYRPTSSHRGHRAPLGACAQKGPLPKPKCPAKGFSSVRSQELQD